METVLLTHIDHPNRLQRYAELSSVFPYRVTLSMLEAINQINEIHLWYDTQDIPFQAECHPAFAKWTYFFKDDEHATMFKMMFGGKQETKTFDD